MGILRSREQFSNKGLGSLEVRQIDPTPDAAYFNLGYLAETTLSDLEEHEIINDENGDVVNVLEKKSGEQLQTQLEQVGLDQMNYILGSSAQKHSIRYFGLANPNMFQYFCFPYGKIIKTFSRAFKTEKQTIPFQFLGLYQESTLNLPYSYKLETRGKIRTCGLNLWVSPRHQYGLNTPNVLDASGFERHGVLNDPTGVWQAGTPANYLQFDGATKFLSFSNICDMVAGHIYLLDFWFNTEVSAGANETLLAKKVAGAGFKISKNTSNKFQVDINDGVHAADSIEDEAGVLSNNNWNHAVFLFDFVHGQLSNWLNGVLRLNAAAITSQNASNVLSLNVAADSAGTEAGQSAFGDLRVYDLGIALPSDVLTIAPNHFAAERSYYGV